MTWQIPRIILVDHPGSGSDGTDLDAVAAAISKSLDGDFAPIYGKSAVVVVGQPTDGDFILGLFADADQPGALGYHDLSPDGKPFGKVFPLLDKQDGANLSTTIDHEVKELLEDETINLSRMGSDGQFWADEPCDAVEQDEYTVDGVTLSNFVTPAWYSGVGTQYDFLSKLTSPLTINPGGYAQYFDPQQGWQQVQSQMKAPRAYRANLPGRAHKRRTR